MDVGIRSNSFARAAELCEKGRTSRESANVPYTPTRTGRWTPEINAVMHPLGSVSFRFYFVSFRSILYTRVYLCPYLSHSLFQAPSFACIIEICTTTYPLVFIRDYLIALTDPPLKYPDATNVHYHYPYVSRQLSSLPFQTCVPISVCETIRCPFVRYIVK